MILKVTAAPRPTLAAAPASVFPTPASVMTLPTVGTEVTREKTTAPGPVVRHNNYKSSLI